MAETLKLPSSTRFSRGADGSAIKRTVSSLADL
jgi:hypothetical protein